MPISMIGTIIAQGMKIAAMLIGDKLLAKWLYEGKLWLRSNKDSAVVRLMEEDFAKLENDLKKQKEFDGPV